MQVFCGQLVATMSCVGFKDPFRFPHLKNPPVDGIQRILLGILTTLDLENLLHFCRFRVSQSFSALTEFSDHLPISQLVMGL